MDRDGIEAALNEVFDRALLFHAFTDCMRDYEMVLHAVADPATGIAPEHLRYLFLYWVEARTETTVLPNTWERSLDDALTDHESGVDLDGYVWGVKWQCMYSRSRTTARVRTSTALGGVSRHPVLRGSHRDERHKITLVFSDLAVAAGYAPFRISTAG